MFSYRLAAFVISLSCALIVGPVALGEIEALKGKRYTLNVRNGPWMILVAAIRDVPEGERKSDGMSAWEAADQIVYELRVKGVPAYTFLQNMELGAVKTHTNAKNGERKYIARHEAIAVLAGNFSSPDDEMAQKVLDYLKKKWDPAFLKDPGNGGLMAKTPGRPLPFSRAHMTTNPLMSQSEVKKRTIDPLVKRLNGNMEHTLLKNRGKYTLKVATFRGNAVVQVGSAVSKKAQNFFESKIGSNLDESGTQAWELTEALRSGRRYGYERDFEAYVFHDRYESYVTIGGFDSPNDPRIVEVAKRFGGKQNEYKGQDVATAEVFTIPKDVKPGVPPEKFWMFDLKPTLMEVPRLR